jgi:ABC-type multidrug transport system fused ATPase/permease subunit
MLFNVYIRIKNNLSKIHFFHFNLFIFFSIIAMILEMIGIGLIIPIINIFTQDEIFFSKFTFLNDLQLNDYSKTNLISISLICLITVYLFKTIFLTYVSYKQTQFITDIRKTISQRLFVNYLERSYEFFLNKNSSELIRNINDIANFCVLLRAVLMFLTELTILIGISLLLIIYEPTGSIVVLFSIGLIGILFSNKIKKKAEFWGTERRNAEGYKMSVMQESFRLIKEIKISNLNKYFITKFISSNNLAAVNHFKHEFVLSLPRYWFELIAIFGFTILIIVLTYTTDSTTNIIATIGLFAAATFRLLPSIIKMINYIQQVHFSLPVLNNLSEEFNLEKKVKNNQEKFDTKFIIKKELILKNISFKYQNSNNNVLDNINLKIKTGSIIGIKGPSGVGKTTLVNIILGLLKPTSGEVLVDGIDINKNLESWQKNIGYVPQNIVLTDDTLKNNIALGIDEKQIDKNRINNCIKESQLENFISNVEKGIDTDVGELGSKLSGGQKQRIGIARSIYNDPQVLILDEFTSALDNQTEEKIISEISNYGKTRTVIIVSHKLSTLSKCNNIYELTKENLKLI